jgi:hypothetical protein
VYSGTFQPPPQSGLISAQTKQFQNKKMFAVSRSPLLVALTAPTMLIIGGEAVCLVSAAKNQEADSEKNKVVAREARFPASLDDPRLHPDVRAALEM